MEKNSKIVEAELNTADTDAFMDSHENQPRKKSKLTKNGKSKSPVSSGVDTLDNAELLNILLQVRQGNFEVQM
ncbi:MAG TPA: hypothetical protein VD905_21750, partial [Flavobacteriales bacterium]|nr:hypothetical protein [Flavobacteriales bacterium]